MDKIRAEKFEQFVRRFACQTRKIDHIGFEEWPLTELDLSLQRDRDITTARELLAELTGGCIMTFRKPEADIRGYTSTQEHLESVLRHLENGRVDLAHAIVSSMIGRKMAEKG